MFFIFTPILIYRLGFHLSLGAQWLILAFIYLELSNNKKNILLYKTILIIISSLIHFYFTIMLLLMNSFFSFYNYLKNKNFSIFLRDNIFVLTPLLITMYIVGYFTIPASDTLGYGYGFFKANVLTFFDPANSDGQSWSIFLPDISTAKGEYEGFGYLGLGILSLNMFLIFYIFKNFIYNLKKYLKYILISIIFLLLAFTQTIHISTFELINIDLPKVLYAPLSIIRASGRFIWPVYYLLIFFSLIAFYKLQIKNRYLVFLLVLQLVDLSQGIQNNFHKEIKENNTANIIWNDISENFNSVVTTYPSDSSDIFIQTASLLVERKFDKTNIFRLGRYNRKALSESRSQLYLKFFEKKINKKTIYFVENIDHLRNLKILFKDDEIGFFKINETWLMLANQKLKMNDNDIDNLSLVNIRKINLKEKLSISFKDPNGILGFGWSHTKNAKGSSLLGVWSEGYKSSLIFDLNNQQTLNQLILTINEVSIVDNKPLLVKIYLNNQKIETLELKNLKDQKITINLSKNILNKKINTIDFEIENPSTPLSRLESVDARLLGILIKDISFQ